MASYEPGEMYCCTFLQLLDPDDTNTDDQGNPVSTPAAFQMININNDGGRLFAMHWDGRFMAHNDAIFANISPSRTANAAQFVQSWDTPAYFFGLVKIESRDEIRIAFPDSSAF